MTGGEMLPVANAAGKAISDDADTKKVLAELAKSEPEMKAAAVAKAKRTHLKQAALLQLYRPLGKLMGVSRDYFESDFVTDMAEKLSDVPDEVMIQPKGSVFGPAVEGLRYSLDEAELKEMYLNLLAKASDRRSAGIVHPSHGEIIRQLSEDEVGLLSTVLLREVCPIVRLRLNTKQGEGHVVFDHLLNLQEKGTGRPIDFSGMTHWVDNWERLGLVEVGYMNQLVHLTAYTWVEGRNEFIAVVNRATLSQVNARPDQEFVAKFERGVLRATSFGKRFAQAVLPPDFSSEFQLPFGPEPTEESGVAGE